MAEPVVPIEMTLSGVDELMAAFKELGSIGARAAMQDALKKGAQLVRDRAEALAPRSSEIGPRMKFKPHLKDSIVVRSSLSRSQMRRRGWRREEAEVFVGPTVPHAHLVEFGHLQVAARDEGAVAMRGKKGSRKLKRVKTKRVVGHVPAHPFMRPAFDTTKDAAAKVVLRAFGASLAKVGKRYAGQAARGKLSRGAKLTFGRLA